MGLFNNRSSKVYQRPSAIGLYSYNNKSIRNDVARTGDNKFMGWMGTFAGKVWRFITSIELK